MTDEEMKQRARELAETLSQELLEPGNFEVNKPSTFEADAARIIRDGLAAFAASIQAERDGK